MMLRLSLAARTALAAALCRAIDAGGAGAALELYDRDGGRLLVRLPLPHPCGKVSGVSLDLGPVPMARAGQTGRAGWARIADRAGETILECDAGERDAVLALNSATITKGGPVVIDRFVIAVPE